MFRTIFNASSEVPMEGSSPDLFKIESEVRRKRQLEGRNRVPMYEGNTEGGNAIKRAGKAAGIVMVTYLLTAFRLAAVWSMAALMIVGFLWVLHKLVS